MYIMNQYNMWQQPIRGPYRLLDVDTVTVSILIAYAQMSLIKAHADVQCFLWGYWSKLWSESSSTSILCVCKKRRLWRVRAYAKTLLSIRSSLMQYVPKSRALVNLCNLSPVLFEKFDLKLIYIRAKMLVCHGDAFWLGTCFYRYKMTIFTNSIISRSFLISNFLENIAIHIWTSSYHMYRSRNFNQGVGVARREKTRKPVSGDEQQRRRAAWASAPSYQRLCYPLFGKVSCLNLLQFSI